MLAEDPTLNGSELHFDSLELGRGERFSRAYAQRPLSLNAYPLDARGRIDGAPVDLLPETGPDGVEWQNPWPRALVAEVKAERRRLRSIRCTLGRGTVTCGTFSNVLPTVSPGNRKRGSISSSPMS